MADVKISGLPASTVPLAGTEVLPIVQGGTTKQVSVNNLTAGKTVLAAAFDTDIAAAAVTLSGTTLAADGTDTNINLAITPKGSGGLGINGSPTGDLAGSTLTAKFCVKQDESGPVAGFVKANNSAATPGATVYGCRSRGTLAAPTIVQNGDVLATYLGLGFDGTDLAIAADIEFQVDGTPGSDDMPGRILFKTTPDGTQTPVEALRINSAQVATFAQPIVGSISSLKSNATTGVLQVAGPDTGTTRVMTTPDANFTAARTDAGQTFTGSQTINGVVTVPNLVDSGGFYKLNNGSNAASRSWRIANDISNYGDFAIQQSTTQTGGTYANIIYSTAGGVVGINSAPNTAYNAAFKLQVGADSGTNGIMIRGAESYLSFDNNVQALGSGRVYYNMGSHYMALFTNNTEKLRIASSGGVSIGNTTDPGATNLSVTGKVGVGVTSIGNEKLNVTGTENSKIAITHDLGSGQSIFSNGTAAAGTGWNHFNGVSNNGTVQNIFIAGNGNVTNANGVYGTLSDVKLKENIVDASPKLDKLMQVKVRSYNLKGDYEQHKQLGVIAQELEQVFPSLIEETSDKDIEGNDLGTTTKSVKYSIFVPMLVKAMQELNEKVVSLEKEIFTLKNM